MDKSEIENYFELFKNYLKILSEDVEKEYIQNNKYPRDLRLHKWYQCRKDIDISIKRLNHIEGKLFGIIEDAPRWEDVNKNIFRAMQIKGD